jgi:hypothetical protein
MQSPTHLLMVILLFFKTCSFLIHPSNPSNLFNSKGGDQGLLNSFFSTWAQRDSVLTSRLPFTFNVTPSPYYTYMPAFVHFARDLKIAHFIGPAKPWKWNRGKDGSVLNQCVVAL